MQLQVDNCRKCGKVYNRNIGDVCPACLRELEEQYYLCIDYLRENRRASMVELSDATGVPIRTISRFIREKRISIAEAPNLSYPCEVCQQPIAAGKLCEQCRAKLNRDIKKVQEETTNTQQGHDHRSIYETREQQNQGKDYRKR